MSHQILNIWCQIIHKKRTSPTLQSSCTHTVDVLQRIRLVRLYFQVPLQTGQLYSCLSSLISFLGSGFLQTFRQWFLTTGFDNGFFYFTHCFGFSFLFIFNLIFVSFGFLFLALLQFSFLRQISTDLSIEKVWHQGLHYKLRQNDVSGKLLNTLTDFLDNRTQRVILKDQFSS